MKVKNNSKTKILNELVRIRIIEEEIAKEYKHQQMRCPVHLSIGQEAIPVGVSSVLTKKDYIVSTHRCHAHYLAKGGSLENAIVVQGEKILNEDGLRNRHEFVYHKILDCIGDLSTSGYRIIASVICSQGGHYLTNQLLRKVFQNKENFSILEIKEKNLPHALINRNILKSIA